MGYIQFKRHMKTSLIAIVLAGICSWTQAKTLSEWLDAARFGDTWALSNMAFSGQDLNARNERGNTALHAALIEPNIESIRWLVRQPGIDLNARNAVGETALMQAIIHGHREIAMALLDAGAEVNQTGWTPLHYAAASKAPTAPAFVRLLLGKYVAYIDAESPNGTTPLMMAARYGQLESIQILLNGGADLGITNQQGLTAMDFAKASEHPDNTKLLAAVYGKRAEEQARLAQAQAARAAPEAPEPARTAPVSGGSKPIVFEAIPKGQW